MLRLLFSFLVINVTLTNSGVCAEKTLLISPSDCIKLTRHRPDADVNYQSGVDVRGKAVAPADLENNNEFVTSLLQKHEISFQMILDLGKEVDSDLFSRHPGLRPEMVLGKVTVKDGIALFNGQALSGAQNEKLWLLCQEKSKK